MISSTWKIDSVQLLGPADLPTGCGGLSMAYADAVLDNEARYLADLSEADAYATDPGIASEALGYDVEPGHYDITEVAAALMRMCGGWK